MGLFTADVITPIVRPNQQNSTGNALALAIEQYGGMVEGTIARRSVLKGWVPMRPVKGTTTVSNYAIGEATLGKVTPGVAPDAATIDFSKSSVVVDTLVFARNVLPLLDVFQTQFDARQEIASEHGKKISKFFDQSLFIQAAKVAQLTDSVYAKGTAGKPQGHKGGSVQVLPSAGAALDPALLYSAVRSLVTTMENKDVSPRDDDCILAVRPEQFYALADAEQLTNTTYTTAAGNRMDNVWVYKAFGIPVVSSINIPNSAVTGHLLSNASNANAYDGDFTKLVGTLFSARALLAGETIPLTSDVFYDKIYKSWFVDSHLAYGVTGNRAEYAGVILLP